MSILRMANKINVELPDLKWKRIEELNLPVLYDCTLRKSLFDVSKFI